MKCSGSCTHNNKDNNVYLYASFCLDVPPVSHLKDNQKTI